MTRSPKKAVNGSNGANLGFEEKLWQAADEMRRHMDPGESVRVKLRTLVKRILLKHGYPPDKQEKATQTVLQQAELICKDWAE